MGGCPRPASMISSFSYTMHRIVAWYYVLTEAITKLLRRGRSQNVEIRSGAIHSKLCQYLLFRPDESKLTITPLSSKVVKK